ncbi:hypothetical protein [Cupriavidus sp. AU9028]|uniref:hypothetical protein n=1 Tax=Cupriavidus sp. AU9028 TaxID=2871157 RepID=UPI001C944364|nr:hypothetical protein [Cupriavidus sp. AU9028]MBY4898661.1 hypothetical protein [Cupriavidus sp. AU9028]
MENEGQSNLPAPQDKGQSLSILQMTRLLLASEVDTAAIGRIVHAAEQIAQARERIRTEYMLIGSYLADIHQTMYIALNKRLENPARAKTQAGKLLNDYASNTLQISKHTVIQYLQVYQRFVNSSEAVEFLNLGELTILKRSDISDAEVQLLVDARKRQEQFSRDEIVPFIERYRAANDEINTLMAQLETAKEQLAAGTSEKIQLELEIKYLRELSATSGKKESELRDALAAAQIALDSQSNTVHSLQLAVERFGREKTELEKRVSEMRVREVVKEVEVVPRGYQSIKDAIDQANQELADTNAALSKTRADLSAAQNELLDSKTLKLDERQLSIRLTGIKADIEAATEKFQTSFSTAGTKPLRPLLVTLRDAAKNLYELVDKVAGAKP